MTTLRTTPADPNLAWPGPPPTGRLARTAAYLLAAAVLAMAVYRFVLDWQAILALRPVALHVWAAVAEEGGWQGEGLRVASGRTVDLTVHSRGGVHTFALAHTDVASNVALQPGDATTVRFTAPAPGRYVLDCTTWCSPFHWRMRTVIEVYDPTAPDAPLTYPQLPARYAIAVAPHELDMPHSSVVAPSAPPRPATGAAWWRQAAPATTPAAALAALGWPNVTPAAARQRLQTGDLPGLAAAQTLPEADLWALVAFLWQGAATPDALTAGRSLYQQNCAACHGDQGRGDGFAVSFSPGQEPDFTDLAAAAGAAPALYYAKLARGGMGTGMPNWGVILTEDELWALVSTITGFTFDSTDQEP